MFNLVGFLNILMVFMILLSRAPHFPHEGGNPDTLINWDRVHPFIAACFQC